MKTRRVILISAVVACIVALSVGLGVGLSGKDSAENDDTPNPTEPWKNFRLPENILPTHYHITLRPNIPEDINYGHEIIEVDVVKPTSTVIIHALAGGFTDIQSFVVRQGSSGAIPIKENGQFYYSDDELKQQYYVVQLEQELAKGTAELEIEWTGDLTGTLVGINKVTYTDGGVQKYIIATKFEPTYAREAFPCFDEPAMKANFSLTMYHEETHHGLWNMPVTKRDCDCDDCDAKMCRTDFMTSPIMGTYQPTFIIHDMDFIESVWERPGTDDKIPLRVYAPYDKIAAGQADHAMQVQEFVMAHYEEEFGIVYPLPKLDLIAIPDFVTGAMEQWGLITYRETSLLWDPVEGSTSSKQSTAATIAHEMVHQWFGNLVTMEWWDNIWLNEGFATFYKYGAIEAAFPEENWDTENQQIYSDIIYSLNRDVVSTSRPIIADVRNPDEITAAFDWVIYQKGSSVIHMIKEAMGADHYFTAIKDYLEVHAYSNATERGLFDSFQKIIDKENIKIDGESENLDVYEMWMPFLRQSLYPLLDITRSGDTYTIKQKQGPFLHNPDSELPENTEYNWQYPMVLRHTEVGGASGEKLMKAGAEVTVKSTGLLKFNSAQTSFHRCKYDQQLRSEFIAALENNHQQFHELDRTGLMDDAFHLAISGDYSYPDALDIVNYISDINNPEDSYYAWDLFSSRTSYMRSMLKGTETGDRFIQYFKPAIAKQFENVGFDVDLDNDSHIQKKKRTTICSLAVAFGVDAASDEARALFKAWRESDGQKKPHPDVRSTVYQIGVREGDQSDWEFVRDKYLTEIVASEKRTLMRAMAATENVKLIDIMLNEMAMDDTVILTQDFFTFISYLSYSEMGNKMTFDWTRVHWNTLVDRFGTGDRNFGRMVPGIVDGYNTEYGLWAAKDFFDVTDGGAGEGPREQALQKIESNIIWVQSYIEDIDEWLSKKVL